MEYLNLGKLVNPKVKDLIRLLLQFNQDEEISIEDADTGWEINIIHFEKQDGKIFMSGVYREMGSP